MKKFLILLFPVVLLASCVDSLDEYNIDQKQATDVPPVTLFTNAIKELTDVITTPNVNTNNMRLYAQQWTTTQYLDEPRYNMTSRLIPQNFWQALYRDVLADLRESKRLVEANELLDAVQKQNQIAQIEIMQVYAWSVLVTTFGDVPYTQAFDPDNSLPAYDDDQAIYADLLTRLDAALAGIDDSEVGFEEGDVLYNGDMEKWFRFGNSLKLRMGMILADVDAAKAKTTVEQALPNVMKSNADNAVFQYLASQPNNNPVSNNVNTLFTSREDFIPANTLIDVLNNLNDPRRSVWFTQTASGAYAGGRYGFPNDYTAFSHFSDLIIDPTNAALLMDYAEVEFLLAEAVERGFITGSAQEHYNKGIEASLNYWGVGSEYSSYIRRADVAYTTAPGDYKQKIGRQLWIAMFNRGYEAWLHWRRLDAPNLLPPSGAGVADLKVPVRLIYPINEQTLNGANRTAASQALGGEGDSRDTKLFWDRN